MRPKKVATLADTMDATTVVPTSRILCSLPRDERTKLRAAEDSVRSVGQSGLGQTLVICDHHEDPDKLTATWLMGECSHMRDVDPLRGLDVSRLGPVPQNQTRVIIVGASMTLVMAMGAKCGVGR